MKHLKFHEDLIFKNVGQKFGPTLLKIMNLKGEIKEIHQTEFSILDPKIYKPDLVFEVENQIFIIEFQSSYVDIDDEKRFRLYTALIDHLKNEYNKEIELHVLSTTEKEKTKVYKINKDSSFPIYIHSLHNHDGNQFLNMINYKIENKEVLGKEELVKLSLVPFMKTNENIEEIILKTAITITNIDNLNNDIGQFIKGIELLLTDKFVETENLNMTIRNLLGGNMKIVEDYAQDKVNEKEREIVINMYNKGLDEVKISDLTGININFIKKTILSK